VTLGLDGAKFARPALLTSLLALKWPALETLDLSNVGLGPSGAAAVASLAAPKLESLDLTYTRLKDEGAAAVLASPLLRTLKEVSLRANTLSVAAVAPVLKAKHSLRLLNLKKNAIGAAALKQLEKKLPGTRLSR
jgi:Ran GTPase-activating protein (RanGAP) involved in mRNA processing and transport